MNELWCCFEHEEIVEIFDSKETAKIAYRKWCENHEEDFNEDIFEKFYIPLSSCYPIWTKDNINEYKG